MIINGIDLVPLPVTLKNEVVCRAAYQRAKEYIQTRNVESVLRNIARLRSSNEILAECIDEIGMINRKTIIVYAERLKENHRVEWLRQQQEAESRNMSLGSYEPMNEEAAAAIAEQEINANLRTFMKDNPDIGKQLYFDVDSYPTTIDALKTGIGIIRDTVDRDRLTDEEISSIDSGLDSEYWQNVAAPEVAEYVSKFCRSYR